jgi:hypothetical protein
MFSNLARIAYSTYFAGIGLNGLYGIYLSNNDTKEICNLYNSQSKKSHMCEFIDYSAKCGYGFACGILYGSLWPFGLIGKTFSIMDKLDLITKNN